MWRLIPYTPPTLDDPKIKRALPRYVGVVIGERQAKYVVGRHLGVEYSGEDSTGDLWRLHDRYLDYAKFEKRLDSAPKLEKPKRSFLDLKTELAKRIMGECHFCERRCGVNRLIGGRGYCSCGDVFSLSSFFAHMGEEPELVPSGTVFTCGCTMRCIHCQNYDISQWLTPGQSVNPSQMARIVSGLRDEGCRNLNMVGGEPTPNAWLWIETMRQVDVNIPTVWNSNSYYSDETSRLLAGFSDLYLLDFKYGNNRCAEAISDAPGYWDACTRNHLAAKRFGELVIRVLVLPGHNECCTRPILEWISGNLGPWTRVNLMFQYRPEWRASERPELRRRLTREETDEALKIAREAGLKNLVRDTS
jgi:putative pyruvate formate lyase activating enzyme